MNKPVDHNAVLVAELRRLVGPTNVLTEAMDRAPYEADMRGLFKGEAIAVVRPANAQEVSACVKATFAAGVPLVPQGGNTGLCGGAISQRGLVLSLQRMTKVRNVDPVNMTMTLDAGCTLMRAQEAAAEAGCLYPLSLGSEGTCTVGGNLSTNAGGTAVLRYGNARELALGLEVVLPDGRIWNGLNRLRKDNTGYDLRNLFIGAEGTLGIITAAVLKLFPMPRSHATAWLGCRSAQDALKLFNLMRSAAGDTLTAFEYMPRIILDFVLRHAEGTSDPLAEIHASYVLVEVASPDPAADMPARLEALLGEALEADLIQDAAVASSTAQRLALWNLRERMSDVQVKEGGSIKHDVSVPVSRVADFLDQAIAACARELEGLRFCAFGHFGDGNIHFNISQPVGMDKAAYLAMWEHFNRIVHDIVASLGGSISAEHGIGLLKREELRRYKDPVAIELMRQVKQALDPMNLMNPGKVIPDPG